MRINIRLAVYHGAAGSTETCVEQHVAKQPKQQQQQMTKQNQNKHTHIRTHPLTHMYSTSHTCVVREPEINLFIHFLHCTQTALLCVCKHVARHCRLQHDLINSLSQSIFNVCLYVYVCTYSNCTATNH